MTLYFIFYYPKSKLKQIRLCYNLCFFPKEVLIIRQFIVYQSTTGIKENDM